MVVGTSEEFSDEFIAWPIGELRVLLLMVGNCGNDMDAVESGVDGIVAL